MTRQLIGLRARADLVRLRLLLAVVCWRAHSPRWRRHLHAALQAGRRPGYERLLSERDPELSVAFWSLALVEGVAVEPAQAALAALGQVQPLLPLLAHPAPGVRARSAAAVARLGDEAAMPALARALDAETEPAPRAALAHALAHLEDQPPPPLAIRLLGGYGLRRGPRTIPSDAFPRPIVLRLLQYFALHRGQPLPRERLLDDLWPNTPPAKAAATFRSVYSRLRKVLEPYMRPKGPSRYFVVDGDSYCFDPHGRVAVDVEKFLGEVGAALSAARDSSVPPLPPALLAALAAWAPLLPELPAEDWLLPARQRVDNAYVEGCLYAAQACLARGDSPAGAQWAQRVIDQAPWLEEGYQALMRAHARQGQRSTALKLYAQAAAALAQELAVEPSPLTRWLRERLERGEDI